MTSAYILFLNPLILSGASNGFNTGMPRSDIVLATAISTAIATSTMGLVANYPVSSVWVCGCGWVWGAARQGEGVSVM